MTQNILSISQINEYIRAKMDSDDVLASVAVRGEISNYKLYPSGHHYFTLKDESSALKCVMFKGNAMRLKFRPENGMKVVVTGRISVFPRDGVYQMYCNTLTPEGTGDLAVAFEQLKTKLFRNPYSPARVLRGSSVMLMNMQKIFSMPSEPLTSLVSKRYMLNSAIQTDMVLQSKIVYIRRQDTISLT